MKKKPALHHIVCKSPKIDFVYLNFPILTSGAIEGLRTCRLTKPKRISAKKKAHRAPL